MIKVKIFRNSAGFVYGFDIDNHGRSIVCAAVSVLALNTVNCIEKFTAEESACDYNVEGGHLSYRLSKDLNDTDNHDAALLLNALVFGLYGVAAEYKNSLVIKEVI